MTVTIIISILVYNSLYGDFLSKGLGMFHGLFHSTAITQVFHVFAFITTAIILNINAFYPRKTETNLTSSLNLYGLLNRVSNNKADLILDFITSKTSEQYRIMEYPLIILFVIVGGIFLISSSDLISLFLAIELQSYGLYILCCVYRNSESSTSAGLTYFLLGGLSSCFILLASGLLYSNSGSTIFDSFYIINDITYTDNNQSILDQINSRDILDYIRYSLIIMSVGLLFKVTAAPFHIWSPDVYDAIPTVVTAFVATFTKISIFILLLEIVHYTSNSIAEKLENIGNFSSQFDWTYILVISSLISLIIGSVLGLTQNRIKRLYAYSTISHVGFILLALVINSVESIQAFIFYLMQYTLSNINAFVILITMGYSLYIYKDKYSGKSIINNEESPIQLTSEIKGYFYINPALSLCLCITIFSFVGIPPLLGFFAKQTVLSSALQSGYVFMALIAILTSVISAYYYLTLVKQMFFDYSNYVVNADAEIFSYKIVLTEIQKAKSQILNYRNINNNDIVISGSLSIIVSMLTLLIILFILNPNDWLSLTSILSLIISN